MDSQSSLGICDVSIIIPIYNGEQFINDCFTSILQQNLHQIKIEICVCNDASTDYTQNLLETWLKTFKTHNISLKIYNNNTGKPLGVGYGKNRAISLSCGRYLCFQDIDDIMLPERVYKQYTLAKSLSNDFLIGSKFVRDPPNSTERYTKWANSLTENELKTQIYTSNGPTVIMPTWFCHRQVFEKIRKFSENGQGTPEDLIFFYKHLDFGGNITICNDELIIYKYHQNNTTFSILEETIWKIRIERLENLVLSKWKTFTIWNAGKQGRKFYKSLKTENKCKVLCLCDVDEKKIGKFYEVFNEKERKVSAKIPIKHFSQAEKPFVLCVKLDLTLGKFEENLKSLNLVEGNDYVYFS